MSNVTLLKDSFSIALRRTALSAIVPSLQKSNSVNCMQRRDGWLCTLMQDRLAFGVSSLTHAV